MPTTSRAHVEDPAVESEPLVRACLFRAGQARRAPEDRLDPRQQISRVERLHHIVVGPHFEPDYAIGVLHHGGEQDYGHVGALAQMPAQREPVLARHHDVQDDEIDGAAPQEVARLCRAGCQGDAQAVLFQVAAKRLPNVALIVDEEDVRVASMAGPDLRQPHDLGEADSVVPVGLGGHHLQRGVGMARVHADDRHAERLQPVP